MSVKAFNTPVSANAMPRSTQIYRLNILLIFYFHKRENDIGILQTPTKKGKNIISSFHCLKEISNNKSLRKLNDVSLIYFNRFLIKQLKTFFYY